MKEELDYFLVKRFPEFFKNRYDSAHDTSMCWGFECGDGWFNLLYQTCVLVEGHIKHIEQQNEFRQKIKDSILSGKEVHETWQEEYKKNLLEPKPVPMFVASQVKEKFGTLRFYYDGGDEYINGVVSFAENSSGHTCEECGKLGKIRHGGWVRTLCDEHAKVEIDNKIEVGVVIYALTDGDNKAFIIKEMSNDTMVGKINKQEYDHTNKQYIKSESEENYSIKKVVTEVFEYYDAKLIE